MPLLINRDSLLSTFNKAIFGLSDKNIDIFTKSFLFIKKKKTILIRATNRVSYINCTLIDESWVSEEDFSILIPGKEIVNYLGICLDDFIELKLEDGALRFISKSDSVCFSYHEVNDSYPVFPSLLADLSEGTEFNSSDLIDGLSFVKNHILESSQSPKETILQLRNSNIIGGSFTSIAHWKKEGIKSGFVLQSVNVRALIGFLKLVENDTITFIEKNNTYYFMQDKRNFFCCSKLDSRLQVPQIETSIQKISPNTSGTFAKKEFLLALKKLRFTLDDNNTDLVLRFRENIEGFQLVCKNSNGQESILKIESKLDMSDNKNYDLIVDIKLFLDCVSNYTNDIVHFDISINSDKTLRLKEDIDFKKTSTNIIIRYKKFIQGV